MSLLDTIVNVSVSTGAPPVDQASFSVPLIVGPTSTGWTSGDRVHIYTDPSGMLTDGYTLTSPEYVYAAAMFAGSKRPSQFMTGTRSGSSAAPVDTFKAPVVATGNVFGFTLNGTALSYTAAGGDTEQQVLQALATQATAAGGVTTLISNDTDSHKLLTITGTTPGTSVTYTNITSNLTHVAVTSATGIGNDLLAIAAQNNGWYGLALAGATDTEKLQAASYVESNRKIMVAASSAAAIGQSGSSDFASQLKAASYKRTLAVFSPANAATGIDAAWMGAKIALTPGSNNWAYANLPGQVADKLTDTQASIALGKNANVYQAIGGLNVMRFGTAASGDYIDITIGLDWLRSTVQTNIYQILVDASARGEKIPYTDAGAAQIAQGVYSAILQAGKNGLVDLTQGYTVNVTKVADTPKSQRANRICPDISFSCILAGAINTVRVNGTVSVAP